MEKSFKVNKRSSISAKITRLWTFECTHSRWKWSVAHLRFDFSFPLFICNEININRPRSIYLMTKSPKKKKKEEKCHINWKLLILTRGIESRAKSFVVSKLSFEEQRTMKYLHLSTMKSLNLGVIIFTGDWWNLLKEFGGGRKEFKLFLTVAWKKFVWNLSLFCILDMTISWPIHCIIIIVQRWHLLTVKLPWADHQTEKRYTTKAKSCHSSFPFRQFPEQTV